MYIKNDIVYIPRSDLDFSISKTGEETEDINCRLCNNSTEWETPHHLICKCEALMHRRKSILGDFFLPDDPIWDIKNLMDFLNCSTIADLEDDEE